MRIAVLKEDPSLEPRVAATPETVKKFAGLGAVVAVEAGAGSAAGMSDAQYRGAGAEIAENAAAALADADLVLKVRRPDDATHFKHGAAIVALMDPYGHEAELRRLAEAGLQAFSLELIPRITRAQVMDVLSSQANLSGYQAVIEAAAHFGRALPMMMTAAGTVPAARVFIMGAGVAGLQAVATARRLGAIVSATDVRPAAKEQVASLGAKFIAVEDEEFKAAETAAGYAKEMSKEYQAKQASLVKEHIAKQDIVITTALIPGRLAPKLVTAEMVASMADGSVIVDLAVERGGNVEGAVPGAVAKVGGTTIVGYLNMAGRIAASSSALLARNIYAFVEPMIDKETKQLAVRRDDEIVVATLLTADGVIVHPAFAPKPEDLGLMGNEALNAAVEQARQAAEAAAAAAEQARIAAEQAARIALQHEASLDAAGAAAHAASGGLIDPFVFRLSIFVLAIFVGYYVVWSVTPALHTPLMSVTNAISSVIVVGALLAVGVDLMGEGTILARLFGFCALLLASINIFGGFLVTQRMLGMYKRKAKA